MLDSVHPRVLGRPGVYGQRSANFVLQNSDYVLSIGTRMAIPQVGYDLFGTGPRRTVDVVDIDESEGIKHSERIRAFIHADARAFINALRAAATGGVGTKTAWLAQCARYHFNIL